MATSKKDANPSRGRMPPNIRPSSIESSGYGYGARRARSVPSSPDRKFGSSSPSVSGSGFTDVQRPSLSSAGRSISSRTMGSPINGTKTQPFPGVASKPTLVRAKSDKVSTPSQRPPVLSVLPSNSFKDMTKTGVKASPSTLLRRKPSPRPSADSCKAAASLKPSSQRVMLLGVTQGDKVQPLSTASSPGVAARKRLDAANGATTSSKAKSLSQKAMGASTSRKDKHKDLSMQFKRTESINTTMSIEEQLQKELRDPVDLKSMEMSVPDQHEPSYNQPEQVFKDDDESKGHFSEENVDAEANETHNGGQDANGGVKTIYECGLVEEADRSADKLVRTIEMAQVWRKDDPKGNDVIEETKIKLLEERKSRVKALVGAFESVLSFKE